MKDIVKSESIWQNTKTYFPYFINAINSSDIDYPICIIGAADGKFVIPLAKLGIPVIAIEKNPFYIHGGYYENFFVKGLVKRLKEENLSMHVQVLCCDFRNIKIPTKCSGVFTSCSWHYPENYDTSLFLFINKMKNLLCENGIFCAEYMMPCTKKEKEIEHYLEKGCIETFFSKKKWDILIKKYSGLHKELPHIGKDYEHYHKVGFILARKRKIIV